MTVIEPVDKNHKGGRLSLVITEVKAGMSADDLAGEDDCEFFAQFGFHVDMIGYGNVTCCGADRCGDCGFRMPRTSCDLCPQARL